MSALAASHLSEGDEVEVIAGDLQGERGIVDSWYYPSLSYHGHNPDEPRAYQVVLHGSYATIPFWRDQLALTENEQ